MDSNGLVTIASIEPTIFCRHEPGSARDGLRQRFLVTLENPGAAESAALELRMPAGTETILLGTVTTGRTVHEIYVPEGTAGTEAVVGLQVGGRTVVTRRIEQRPHRHWEVHLVHYSHHDYGYTDLASRVLEEHDDHLAHVLAHCRETEGWPEADARFRWLCEQAWSADHFLSRASAEDVEDFVRFAKAGRIEVTALFGNQTLELCGHEELVRLLYPAFGLKRRHGIDIACAEHNDIPGFPWGLASVLAGAGVRYFSPGVPQWYYGTGERRVHTLWDTDAALPAGMPSACWWEGPDGARVLLWMDVHGIEEWQPYDVAQAERDLPRMLDGLESRGYPYDLVSWTVRGGDRDNAPPSMRYAHLAREWNRRWAYPHLVCSTDAMFLREFERRWGKGLKVLRGDVPGTDYGVGAMSTPGATAAHRRAHEWLASAEKLASVASMTAAEGYPYPAATLARAYRDAFFFDEHCWGPMHPGGPAADASVGEKTVHAHRAAALAHDIMVKAGNAIADRIGLSGGPGGAAGWHLVVFNPLSHGRTDVVRAALQEWGPCSIPMHWEHHEGSDAVFTWGQAIGRRTAVPPLSLIEQPFDLVDAATGEPVPYQLSRTSDPLAGRPWAPERFGMAKVDPRFATDIVFAARDLPPMGYRTYLMVPAAAGGASSAARRENKEGGPGRALVVENRFYRLRIRRATAAIESIVDKELGRELVDAGAEHGFGRLLVRRSATGALETARMTEVAVTEAGPVFTTIRITGEAACCPRLVEEVTLHNEAKRIDVAVRLLKDATPLVELYLAFPFDLQRPEVRFESCASVIRPIEDQWPGSNTDYHAVQHWVDLHDRDAGVVWSPLDCPIVCLGGLWPGYVSGAHHAVPGPGYGHHFLRPGEFARGHLFSMVSYNNFKTNFFNVQSGELLVRYAMTSHRGDWREARAWQPGWNAANPPLPVWVRGPREGPLPVAHSFCSIDEANVILVTMKRAEDGDGYVLRLFETEGRATEAALRLPLLGRFEAALVNLVEEPIRPLEVRDGMLAVPLGPFSLVTVRVRSKA